MKLLDRDARALVRLLGELQDHLESVIDSHVVPGTDDAGDDKNDRAIVNAARRKWREAENLVVLLEGKNPKMARTLRERREALRKDEAARS